MMNRQKAEEIAEKINQKFKEEDFHESAYATFKNEFVGYCVAVDIERGDWKHDHGFADYLVEQVAKPNLAKTILTEDDGSDCYSAIHEYYYLDN